MKYNRLNIKRTDLHKSCCCPIIYIFKSEIIFIYLLMQFNVNSLSLDEIRIESTMCSTFIINVPRYLKTSIIPPTE